MKKMQTMQTIQTMRAMQTMARVFMAVIFLITQSIYLVSVAGADTIDNSVFNGPQRPAALFDHDDHNEKAELEAECDVCHHVYEKKKRIEDASSEDSPCSECHSIKSTLENGVHLRAAFHSRCKTCHFESRKGPVLCGECHKRR